MSRRNLRIAATLAVLLVVVTLGAAALPSAAASDDRGRATKISGEYVNPVPAVCTDAQVRDPGVDHGYVDFECTASSFLNGSWMGAETAETHGTWDLSTGDIQGTTRATFIGRAADGSFGTLEREGTATCDATNWCRVEEKILDGTGDFQGSQGHVTFEGTLVGGVGSGEYWGLWIQAGAGGTPE